MTRLAQIAYHVHKPERQAFIVDPDGEAGALIAPETVVHELPLADVRLGETSTHFGSDGIAFVNSPAAVAISDDNRDWEADYEASLRDLTLEVTGAREVIIFDHTIRTDDPASARRPARHVHTDYSREGAEKRLADIVGAEAAAGWRESHFAFVNAWRPLEVVVKRAPLAFIRPSTVVEGDWMPIDLEYPDRKGQVMGLAYADRHEWLYWSRMTPDDVVLFNIFDNREREPVAHSAIDFREEEYPQAIRKSIESRMLLRF